jgi:hypothetical protein
MSLIIISISCGFGCGYGDAAHMIEVPGYGVTSLGQSLAAAGHVSENRKSPITSKLVEQLARH